MQVGRDGTGNSYRAVVIAGGPFFTHGGKQNLQRRKGVEILRRGLAAWHAQEIT